MLLAAESKSVRGLTSSLAILLLAGAASSGIIAVKSVLEEYRSAAASAAYAPGTQPADAHVADQIARQLAESP